jgi:hypothetical protein
VAKLYAHLNEPPPSMGAEVPDRLDDVIHTAMAKAPGERYGSAGQLAAAALRALEAPAAHGLDAPVPAAPSPTPTVRSPAATAPSEPAPSRSRRGLVIGAAAVALAAVAAVVLLVAGGDSERERAPSAAIPSGNVTANPSFEENTTGWDKFQAKLAREQAADAPAGDQVARVTATGPVGEYSIDDDPETVSSSRAGALYTATAWVKATDANDGENICISLREGLEGGGEVRFAAALAEASAGEYRQVRVAYRAEVDGETIGVHVYRAGPGVTEGESFLVDAITITEDRGGGSDGGPVSAECDV